MNTKLIILLLLIIFLYGCNERCGNNKCVYPENECICPNDCGICVGLADKCTEKFCDEGKTCAQRNINWCCGNNKCEAGEDYLSCEADCNKPMQLGELEIDNIYSIENDTIKFSGKIAERNRRQMFFPEFVSDGMSIIIPIRFTEDVQNINADLKCSDSRRTLFTSLDDNGVAMVYEDGKYLFHFEESSFECRTIQPYCITKKYSHGLTILSAKRDAEATLKLQLYVNSKRITQIINCRVKISIGNPPYITEKEFKFKHIV